MPIFERISQIVKANINWLIDKVEHPEDVLESKIKEISDALSEGKACAATYGATFHRMERRQQEIQAQRKELQTKAETALANGDEKLARQALTQRVHLAEEIASLTPGVEQGRETYEQLRGNLLTLQEQLRNVELKHAELIARRRAALAHQAFAKNMDKLAPTDNDEAFDRLEDRIGLAEAEIEISEEIRSGEMLDIDLQQRSRELQIEAELRQIKDKMGQE